MTQVPMVHTRLYGHSKLDHAAKSHYEYTHPFLSHPPTTSGPWVHVSNTSRIIAKVLRLPEHLGEHTATLPFWSKLLMFQCVGETKRSLPPTFSVLLDNPEKRLLVIAKHELGIRKTVIALSEFGYKVLAILPCRVLLQVKHTVRKLTGRPPRSGSTSIVRTDRDPSRYPSLAAGTFLLIRSFTSADCHTKSMLVVHDISGMSLATASTWSLAQDILPA